MIKVKIWKDTNGEYKVPMPDRREESAYFTDDLEDAISTAELEWHKEFREGELDFKVERCYTHPRFLGADKKLSW